jgi:hypothetical protein
VLRLSGWPGAGSGAAAPPADAPAAEVGARPLRHQHLAPVLELGREVQAAEVGAPRRPAGALHRIVDPRARSQPVHARIPDRAGDVYHQPAAAAAILGDRDLRGARRRRLRLTPSPPQLAQPEQQHDRDTGHAERELTGREVCHARGR